MIRSAEKGGIKYRYIPLHIELAEMLKDWYEMDDQIGPIIHYHGRPIKTIKTAWTRALARAGIKRRLRPYDMRHKFVTEALERGEDIKTLSEIVGSSPKTLMQHYQHVSTRMRRKTIDGIPDLGIQKHTQYTQKTKKIKTGS